MGPHIEKTNSASIITCLSTIQWSARILDEKSAWNWRWLQTQMRDRLCDQELHSIWNSSYLYFSGLCYFKANEANISRKSTDWAKWGPSEWSISWRQKCNFQNDVDNSTSLDWCILLVYPGWWSCSALVRSLKTLLPHWFHSRSDPNDPKSFSFLPHCNTKTSFLPAVKIKEQARGYGRITRQFLILTPVYWT